MSELFDKEVKNEIIEDIAGNIIDQEPEILEESGWNPMDIGDLCNMFGDYIVYADEQFANNFNKDDFDYEVFNQDYYAEKFPGFDDEVHEILARVSKEKVIDLRKKKDQFKITHGSFSPFKEEEEEETRDKRQN